jgi:hypothetical protein
MSSDNSKASPKPAPAGTAEPSAKDAAAKTTGRVKFDDRGNAIWEWAITTGAYSPEVSSQRMKRLEHPALSIAEDAPTPVDHVRSNPLGTKKGYDPYDSGKLGKPPAPPRKKDLRKLSEWLKLKKQAGNNKDEESQD